MAEIEKKQLSKDTLTVFKSSGTLGKKQTKRDKVKHAFYKEKLGLKLNEEEKSALFVEKEVIPDSLAEPQEDSMSSPEPEVEPECQQEPRPELVHSNESQNLMEIDTPIEESDSGPQGPTYVEQVASIEAAAPTGLTIRLNDDDLEDVRRLNEDLATEVPEALRGKAYYVKVSRKPEIEQARSTLPVCGMEQEIMESIGYHDVVIVCGETGSGKTTQVR